MTNAITDRADISVFIMQIWLADLKAGPNPPAPDENSHAEEERILPLAGGELSILPGAFFHATSGRSPNIKLTLRLTYKPENPQTHPWGEGLRQIRREFGDIVRLPERVLMLAGHAYGGKAKTYTNPVYQTMGSDWASTEVFSHNVEIVAPVKPGEYRTSKGAPHIDPHNHHYGEERAWLEFLSAAADQEALARALTQAIADPAVLLPPDLADPPSVADFLKEGASPA